MNAPPVQVPGGAANPMSSVGEAQMADAAFAELQKDAK